MKIDTHAHIYPDSLAARVIGRLGGHDGIMTWTDGTLKDTLAKYTQAGIDRFVSLNIATRPNQEKSVNAFAAATDGDRIISFGSVHPYSDNVGQALEQIKAYGLKGIKLHPEYQEYDALDKKAFEVYRILDELGLILVVHSGWDVAYPDSDNASPLKWLKVKEAFPGLKMQMAHFGGMWRWDAVWEHIAGNTDIMLDTAMCARYFPKHFFEKIVSKHGIDKIMYASDCPWESPAASADFIHSFGLSKEEEDMIFYKNAERFYGL